MHVPPAAAHLIAHLMRGIVYNDRQPELWNDLLTCQGAVQEYLRVIGLELCLDEGEGYAFFTAEGRFG